MSHSIERADHMKSCQYAQWFDGSAHFQPRESLSILVRQIMADAYCTCTRVVWLETEQSGVLEATGLDCVITLEKRPTYCDRGNFLAKIFLRPGGNPLRLNLDDQDGWPRYFMDLQRAKQEIEDWMVKRRQIATEGAMNE